MGSGIHYSTEFKIEAVRRVSESSRTYSDVADELTIHKDTLRRWVREVKDRLKILATTQTTKELRDAKRSNSSSRWFPKSGGSSRRISSRMVWADPRKANDEPVGGVDVRDSSGPVGLLRGASGDLPTTPANSTLGCREDHRDFTRPTALASADPRRAGTRELGAVGSDGARHHGRTGARVVPSEALALLHEGRRHTAGVGPDPPGFQCGGAGGAVRWGHHPDRHVGRAGLFGDGDRSVQP